MLLKEKELEDLKSTILHKPVSGKTSDTNPTKPEATLAGDEGARPKDTEVQGDSDKEMAEGHDGNEDEGEENQGDT